MRYGYERQKANRENNFDRMEINRKKNFILWDIGQFLHDSSNADALHSPRFSLALYVT